MYRPADGGRRLPPRVGRYRAPTRARRERYSTFLGSRMVFLIDWNRARKRLRTLVGKKDSLQLLEWAAGQDLGHLGFLRLGGEHAVFDALDFAARRPRPLRPDAGRGARPRTRRALPAVRHAQRSHRAAGRAERVASPRRAARPSWPRQLRGASQERARPRLRARRPRLRARERRPRRPARSRARRRPAGGGAARRAPQELGARRRPARQPDARRGAAARRKPPVSWRSCSEPTTSPTAWRRPPSS